MNQKIAIITGGNRGIALSLTKAFIDAGFAVVVGARSDIGLEACFPGKVRFVSMDVSDEAGHRKLTQAACEWTGRIDVT